MIRFNLQLFGGGHYGDGHGHAGIGGGGTMAAAAPAPPTLTVHLQEVTKQKVPESELPLDDRAVIIENQTGISPDEAAKTARAISDYSFMGYKDMHSGDFTKPGVKEKVELTDNYINNPNVPLYKGKIYRGERYWNNSVIEDRIAKGVWDEPGITSFSTSKKVANSFASDGKNRVILECADNKSAVPIAQLSGIPNEKEVLYPSSIKDRGFTILSHTKKPNKNGGYDYHIIVSENDYK